MYATFTDRRSYARTQVCSRRVRATRARMHTAHAQPTCSALGGTSPSDAAHGGCNTAPPPLLPRCPCHWASGPRCTCCAGCAGSWPAAGAAAGGDVPPDLGMGACPGALPLGTKYAPRSEMSASVLSVACACATGRGCVWESWWAYPARAALFRWADLTADTA